MKVLVVYSTDSAPTGVTTIGAETLIETLLRKGVKVDALNLFGATRIPFMLRLLYNKYDMLCYFGHGTSDSLVGQLPVGLLQRLVDLGNKGLLDNKVVYTVACLSMRKLGKAVRGVYYGSEYYMFVGYPDQDHNYTKDFVDTWLQIPVYLVDHWGNWEKALELYKRKCSEYLKLYEKNLKVWGNADAYSYCMKMNRDYYRVHVR